MASEIQMHHIEDSVGGLNSVLTTSLDIITQFFFHSSMLKDRGMDKLGSRYNAEWFDKMRRYETVLSGILELGGSPASRDCSTLRVGHSIPEILRSDLALEEVLISTLREASTRAESIEDIKTHNLLKSILKVEQEFTDWLHVQLNEIERQGTRIVAPGRNLRDGRTRAHAEVVERINEALKIELSAITQVFYHSRKFESWGIKKLYEFCAAETLAKTHRSVALLRRLLALEGTPASEGHGKLMIGNEVSDMLRCDFEVQESLIPLLRSALDCSDSHSDHETRELLGGMLDYEQRHADWLRTQFDQIKQQGVEGYTQSQK